MKILIPTSSVARRRSECPSRSRIGRGTEALILFGFGVWVLGSAKISGHAKMKERKRCKQLLVK
jgi:hypothetical protein